MPDKGNLPPEVAELFARDGDWSQTRPDFFFWTCYCGTTAWCFKTPDRDEDTWTSYCRNEECDLHGHRPVATVDLDSTEVQQRRQHKDRYAQAKQQVFEEVDHITKLAALRTHPDTPDATLFDNITDILRRFIFADQHELRIVTLWVVHTWTLAASEFTPYIHLRSALPRSGKSRFLDVLEPLVRDGMRIHDPTPAAIADILLFCNLFGLQPPTFLWDEIDSAYERWPSLREIVNAGYQRGTEIPRAGGKLKPTFGPKAMAGLSTLPSTVFDRSFEIDLTRATREERPDRLTPAERRRLHRTAKEIRTQLEAFADRNMEDLSYAEPDLPPELDDRAQDIGECLLALADVAGSDWPLKARNALINVRRRMFSAAHMPEREKLLRDLRRVFGERKLMTPQTIVDALKELDETPWGTLSTYGLSRMLHEFSEYPGGPRIRSKRARIKRKPSNVYQRKQLEDLWRRYLDDEEE